MAGEPPIDRARLRALFDASVRLYTPSFHEHEVTALFADALARGGLEVARQAVPTPGHGGRQNLLVHLGPRDDLSLMLMGHVDTVTYVHGESHAPSWDGDVMHGLGTADMKGGCAAMIEALVAVQESGATLARGVLLALVVGEEEVGDGARAVLAEHEAPLVVIGEPTGLVACTEHYGYLELALEVRGRRAHAALPEVGANAVEAMLGWLLAARGALGRDAALADVVVSVRRIEGGSSLFAVPERCQAIVDVHLPVGRDAARVEEVFAASADALADEGLTFAARRLLVAPGAGVDPGASRLAPLSRALARVGLDAATAPFRSHSDANLFHDLDATPVLLGPGRLEVAHTRKEHVAFEEIAKAAELYAALVLEACAGG